MNSTLPISEPCAALVEQGDPERFRAAMAAPVETRGVLFAVAAFNVEVTRAPWVSAEPMIGEMRLQWWRDVLEEIATGAEVRRHEITQPLAAAITPEGARALDQLVEARRWDLYRDPFDDADHFTDYLEKTSAPLLFAGADALGTADMGVCKDAGYASGLARFFQAIPALEAAGRVPLVDGRSEAIAALAEAGLTRLARARVARRLVHPAPFLALWETEAILKQAARRPGLVADGGLAPGALRSSLNLAKAALSGRW